METNSDGVCCPCTQPSAAEPSVLAVQGSAQPRRGIDRDTLSQHRRSESRPLPLSHSMSYLEFSRETHKGQGARKVLHIQQGFTPLVVLTIRKEPCKPL